MKNFLIAIAIGHLLVTFGCKEEAVNVPAITSFSPATGRLDTEIIIEGINFSENPADMVVRINGVTCPIISSSINEIKTKAIAGSSSGKISVTVGNLAAISNKDFIVKPHTITSISPMEAHVGDEIIFTGSNYADEADSIHLSFYNSVSAEIYDFQSTGETDTIKTFKTQVPQGAETGVITVKIGDVITVSEADFTVIP